MTPGNATTPTTGTITANHTYEASGTFPVVIHLTDEAGVEADLTLDAVIGNVAPPWHRCRTGAFDSERRFHPERHLQRRRPG